MYASEHIEEFSPIVPSGAALALVCIRIDLKGAAFFRELSHPEDALLRNAILAVQPANYARSSP
jgi:hypothetical protein